MKTGSTVAQALDEAARLLASTRPRSPRLDAEVLLGYVLGRTRSQLHARALDSLTASELEQFRRLVEQRGQGVPVAYLVGTKEFYGRNFVVTPDVLIPRPDTELLVERALHWLTRSGLIRPRVLDLCTGSGCVAISLALECEGAVVRASDICPKALAIAEENRQSHNLTRTLNLFEGDLFGALPENTQRFDAIVSNPPYVATDCGPRPEDGVVRYEPNLALFGGRDGTDLIRKLIDEAGSWLNPGGWLLIEMAPFQIEGMEAYMQDCGYMDTGMVPDLSGLPRVLSGRWEG